MQSRLGRPARKAPAISFLVLRTPRERPRPAEPQAGGPDRTVAPESDPSKQDASWEPYKIAIGAFYAICVQRVLEASVQNFNATPPQFDFSKSGPAIHLDSGQVVLVCQLLAFVTWMGLYYINNVRIYFLISDRKFLRRALTHITLTAALAQFYFLASTIGSPTVNQLLLISGILLSDAIFPIVIGSVLSRKLRAIWVLRGLTQTLLVFLILFFVPSRQYVEVKWSAGMLLLMLIQLLVVAPLESSSRRKRLASLHPSQS